MSLKNHDVSPSSRRFLSRTGRLARLAALAGLVASLAACGTPRKPGNYLLDDIDEQRNLPDSGWDALKSSLPPIPTAADTLPIESMAPQSHFRFGIDPRSVRVDPGLIVRYTLYAESDRGAKSATYESLRCGKNEWRIVATVGPDNTWARSAGDQWRPLAPRSVQRLLAGGVFCQGGGPASPKAEALVQRLRSWERYADATAMEHAP